MLPPQHRLRSSDDFQRVMRSGKRIGGRYVVVHVGDESTRESRVGFVVSKAVGNAVTRNRVKRRMRHICSDLVPEFAVNTDVVLRALPRAASGSSERLRTEIRRGLEKAGVLK